MESATGGSGPSRPGYHRGAGGPPIGQWMFSGNYFPMEFHFSVVCSKGLPLFQWMFTGNLQWTLTGVFQWNYTFVVS